MFKNRKIAVIIAAAGMGKRMTGTIPKQYRQIAGKPIIVKSVEAFSSLRAIDYICVVASGEYVDSCKRMLIDKYKLPKISMVVKGGIERQDSVCRGLEALGKETDFDYVLIHDAARPFVSERVIMNVLEAAIQYDAAVAAVPCKDTMRLTVDSNAVGASKTLERDRLYMVQTPQGFERNMIVRAYQRAYEKNFYSTDDASLVERISERVVIAEGDYANIKITTQEDMPMETKVGTGFDAHAFAAGRKLVLGGVEIPYEKGLLGHSDADVLVHAIMDALLGAAGLGDIGRYFPATDPVYKDISSLVLLERVGKMIREEHYSISNIDAVLIAQKPKIAALTSRMKAVMAEMLQIEPERINLKGTTTENMGFTGREEGIAAQATCVLVR